MSEGSARQEVFVGVGGNLGDDEVLIARFSAALAALRALDGVHAVQASPVYRTAPVGPIAAQPAFLNAVVRCEVDAGVTAVAFLAALLAIERALGRVRGERRARFGPRTIDLDLLLWGALAIDEPGPPRLLVPHPRLAERAFVLRPLADLVGRSFALPPTGATLASLLASDPLAAQAIDKTDLRIGGVDLGR